MVMRSASLVWLFDIDGTLLLTHGAGREAMSLALRDRFGVDDDLRTIPFAGRTDTLILGDILDRHGLTLAHESRGEFWRLAAGHMRKLMTPPRGGLLPGVREALDAVAAEPAWARALLTGNVTPMAHLKLGSFGILDHFAWGTFGEEGPDRDSLARLAVARAAERHGVPPERCIVVGDTEWDVGCARAAGARCVAVATGSRSRAELEALGADLVLDDLRQSDGMLEWALRVSTANGTPAPPD
jgi:phosphoglycolate phosphatase-like HAD superfamily hydrolase